MLHSAMIIIITSKLNIDCHRFWKKKYHLQEWEKQSYLAEKSDHGHEESTRYACDAVGNIVPEVNIDVWLSVILPIVVGKQPLNGLWYEFCKIENFVKKSMTSVPGPASWWELQWWSRSPCKALPERHLYYIIITKTILNHNYHHWHDLISGWV